MSTFRGPRPLAVKNFPDLDCEMAGDVVEGSAALAAVRAVLLLIWILGTVPWVFLVMRLGPRVRFYWLMSFYRQLLRICGISTVCYGTPSTAKPTLFVANHTSYLDVIVLGALLPASFVAKQEVSGWPVFGFCARLQGTVFIERRRNLAAEHRDELRQCIEEGRNLIVFPEGTSSDGNRVYPFKSTLFSSVVQPLEKGGAITVQPVSLICTGMDGIPICRSFRSRYSWYGDMTFYEHLWKCLKTGRLTIGVIYHPPVLAGDFECRKALASHCTAEVTAGASALLRGKLEKYK